MVAKGPAQGSFTFSQWPLYIDPGKHGTVANFEKATGMKVKYVEEINDNVQFFGKVRPQLAQGQSGGRSMITVSDVFTTARVVAQPTPSEPPKVERPEWPETIGIAAP